MMAEKGTFTREIREKNVDLLWKLVRATGPNWWKDVLGPREGLRPIIALRDKSLDVYHCGRAIFNVQFRGGEVIPTTHVKYLILQSDRRIELKNGSFDYKKEDPMQSEYAETKTLEGIIKASEYFAAREQKGVHKAIASDPYWLDVEASFTQGKDDPKAEESAADRVATIDDKSTDETASPDGSGTKQDRVDIIVLGDGRCRNKLIFWEAKHISNPDLLGESPAVLEQIERYRNQIRRRKPQILTAYRNVCKFQLELEKMRKFLDVKTETRRMQILQEICDEKEPLHIEEQPRLFIFGINQTQKEYWKKIGEPRFLTKGIPVRFIKEPKEAKLSDQKHYAAEGSV